MSAIANMSGAPSFTHKNVGDAVGGRIVSFEDYQVKEFGTDTLKTFEKSGDPVMGVRIVLEVVPGDSSSAVTLWAEKPRMLKAIAGAVKGTGAKDLEVGGDLAVTFSGFDGRAKAFLAAYARAVAAGTTERGENVPAPEAPEDPWANE